MKNNKPGQKKDLDKKNIRKKRPGVGKTSPIGLFWLFAWSVVMPMIVGILGGIWLNERFPGSAQWILICVFLGLGAGIVNAVLIIKREI